MMLAARFAFGQLSSAKELLFWTGEGLDDLEVGRSVLQDDRRGGAVAGSVQSTLSY